MKLTLTILTMCVLAMSGCVGTGMNSSPRTSRPNIILCMTDDQGWGDVSYNGLKHIQTPNLDAMARAGTHTQNRALTTLSRNIS
jgi:hypothetical protein